jgi:signal transduction histidine kinase
MHLRFPSLWLRLSSFSNPSFRLMLYLEWILLGIILLGAIRPNPRGIDATTLSLSLLILVSFGVMGLRLPTGKLSEKIFYTAGEFGLLFLTFLLRERTAFLPLLGLIIVIRSCLIFKDAGRSIVAGLVFSVFLLMLFQPMPVSPPPRQGEPPPPPRHEHIPDSVANTILTLKLNTAVTFGLTLLFTLLLVNTLLAERQSREKLLIANDQLRQYALRIEDQATLQERNRIAREIHDALGHALTAQSIQLENALLFLPPNAKKSESFLREAQQLGSRALQEVRRSISTLRSDPLQGQSLETVLAKAITEFHQTTGILPESTIQLSQPIPAEIGTALYRILQEALTNISKHSDATQVHIHLQQSTTAMRLQIADNGQGFNPQGNTTGFGLQGMRERTTVLGGQLVLTSELGKGCQICVSIPLPRLTV